MSIYLPEEFQKKMQALLGAEYGEFLASYEQPRQFGLRVNVNKIAPEEFERLAPFHLRRIPWTENGYYYEEEDAPARHPFYYAGLYYLQEPSAMTPASRLVPKPGDRVLDLCAAPGGKATELAARLHGKGLLVANDLSASRAKALLKNLEVFGISNSFVVNEPPARLAKVYPEFFDKILVDAPCSGEGMFRKDPAVARVWTPQKSLDCARQQKEILHYAAEMLAPGGQLLYSTCTFSPEENEQVILDLLESRDDFELIEIPWQEGFSQGRPEWVRSEMPEEQIVDSLRKCVRIWPHRMAGEGHFLALLHRRAYGQEGRVVDGSDTSGVDLNKDMTKTRLGAGNSCQNAKNDGTEMESGEGGADRWDGRKESGEDRADHWDGRKKSGVRPGRHGQGKQTRECGRRNQNQECGRRNQNQECGRRNQNQECGRRNQNQERGGQDQSRRNQKREQGSRVGLQSADASDLFEFFRDVSGFSDPSRLEIRKEQVFYIPEGPAAPHGLTFLRNGLYLGELRKGRFEPSQSLAMALKMDEYDQIVNLDVEDPRVEKYLRGETIEVEDQESSGEKGWQLVCVNGFPLGWGKLTGQILKNKYHPGWRKKY